MSKRPNLHGQLHARKPLPQASLPNDPRSGTRLLTSGSLRSELPPSRRTLSRMLLLPLALPLLPGCLQEIPVPYVGECTEYPVGAFDFGDFTMGDCLGAPTELKFYEGPEGAVLYVVNSNAWMVFGDGSISAYRWDSLRAAIDQAREADDAFVEAGGPALLLTSDPDIEKSSISTPYLNGKLITATLPDGTPVAFVSNRLSLTTDKYAQDTIYAYDLTDPLNPVPLAISEEANPEALTVEEDPWGLAWVDNARGSYLLNVNQSEHSVSVHDARTLPIQPLTGSAVGLVTWPGQDDFTDAGEPSFAETGYLSVGNILDDPADPDDGQNQSAIIADSWTLTWLDGTYRMFLLGQQADGSDVLGYVDSGDSSHFSPTWDEPILGEGDEDAWDSDGLGRTSVLLAPSSDGTAASYYFFYEGWKQTDALGLFPRIGLAVSSSASLLSITKQDMGEEGLDSDNFLIGLGEAGSFTEKGLGSPWPYTYEDRVGLLMEGIDAAGHHSLGLSSAEALNLSEWTVPTALILEGDGGDEQREPTGFYDGRLGRFRIWFTRIQDGESCIAYADSDNGLNFTVGGIDQKAGPCLELPGLNPRAPSVAIKRNVLRLWYQTEGPLASDGSPTYLLQSLYGFDGLAFRSLGETPLDFGMDWEQGAPLPSVFIPTPDDGSSGLSLEGDQYHSAGAGFPVNSVNKVDGLDLYFQILHGHVLTAGERASLVEDSSASTSLSWDSVGVGAPAYDLESDQLYYTGISLTPEDGTESRWVHPFGALGTASQLEGQARWINGAAPVWPQAQTVASGGFAAPAVVHHDGKVWLYYTQGKSDSDGASIRLVTRDEAESVFDSSTDQEVLAPDEVNSETHVGSPSVVTPEQSGGQWHMWFTSIVAGQARIGHASSPDGLTWSRPELGVWALEPAATGSWDDEAVAAPSVLKGPDGVWHLWYAGESGTGAYRIGHASADLSGAEPSDTMVWTRFTADGKGYPVLYNESGWWDVSMATEPSVAYVGDRYRMWYEGRSASERRVGLAESFDGIRWFKVYEPMTTGDRFQFRTRVVSSEDGSSAQGLTDGQLNLESYFGSYTMCGIGATEIAVSPGGGLAAISALHTPGIYLMDTRDDSAGDFFDDNYLSFEAVIALRETSACGPDAAVQGTRSLLFSQDGKRLYATTRLPDSVLVADLTQIEDQAAARLFRGSILKGAIELEPGSSEDVGLLTTTDIGPIGLAMTQDGRYMWVANANANSVYTIDLTLGTVGEVVAVAENVGELPVAIALSPDEKYLLIANYVGDVEERDKDRFVVHSTLAILDADRTSPSFGRVVAHLKNLELK